jgi:hypothetical protein
MSSLIAVIASASFYGVVGQTVAAMWSAFARSRAANRSTTAVRRESLVRK